MPRPLPGARGGHCSAYYIEPMGQMIADFSTFVLKRRDAGIKLEKRENEPG